MVRCVLLRLLLLLLVLAVSAACSPPAVDEAGSLDGVETVEVAGPVGEVVGRLLSVIDSNPNLRLVAVVDHHANAEAIGEVLPEQVLVIFGNPQLGTPLLRQSPSIGLDLPQRVLIVATPEGTKLFYSSPAAVAARHGLDESDPAVLAVSDALDGLTASVANE